MTVWHWIIIGAAVGTAALWLWLWLTWRRPRIRALSTDERIRAADEDEWQRQALYIVDEEEPG